MNLDTGSRPDGVGRTLRCGAALVVTLVVAGCALITEPDAARLSVELSAETVAPGGEVELTLRNASDRSWYYNGICNSDLQRRVGDSWVRVYDHLGAGCPLAVVAPSSAPDWLSWAPMEIPAGQSVTFSNRLPGDLLEGEYRFLALFSRGADGSGTKASQPSPAFQVLSFSLAAR